jgi:hypothetical protein
MRSLIDRFFPRFLRTFLFWPEPDRSGLFHDRAEVDCNHTLRDPFCHALNHPQGHRSTHHVPVTSMLLK